MKSSILTTSAAALIVFGAATTEARAATPQGDRRSPYAYEQREEIRENRAFVNGERDGYSKGLDDVRHHRAPDMHRQKWYRSGDHDYDHHDYGSRDHYRVEYRRGFEQGYERAYREGYWEGWRR